MRFPAEPARVFVDRSQLEAALTNLAVNAREAMPEGGRLTMEAALVQRDDGVRQVALSVSDEGVGMSEEVRERAFEPFFTTKRIGEGSGLGLSMVYGFVKQSGGDVRIDSAPGRGASVTLLLPALPARPPDSLGSDARGHAQGGDETILVVEDEPLVRDFVVGQLRRLGYHVVEAPDGPSALAEIDRTKRLDLVFTDVVMPGGMSGFALAEAARRHRPGLRFLFTSGYSDEEVAQRPRAGAAVDLLHKPYELNELANRIRAALGQART
jgi:CheY-like chemotaxis protein